MNSIVETWRNFTQACWFPAIGHPGEQRATKSQGRLVAPTWWCLCYRCWLVLNHNWWINSCRLCLFGLWLGAIWSHPKIPLSQGVATSALTFLGILPGYGKSDWFINQHWGSMKSSFSHWDNASVEATSNVDITSQTWRYSFERVSFESHRWIRFEPVATLGRDA